MERSPSFDRHLPPDNPQCTPVCFLYYTICLPSTPHPLFSLFHAMSTSKMNAMRCGNIEDSQRQQQEEKKKGETSTVYERQESRWKEMVWAPSFSVGEESRLDLLLLEAVLPEGEIGCGAVFPVIKQGNHSCEVRISLCISRRSLTANSPIGVS